MNFLFNYSYWLRSFLRLDIRNKTAELTFHILSRDVGFVFLSFCSQLRWLSYLVIRNDGKFSHLLLSFLNFFSIASGETFSPLERIIRFLTLPVMKSCLSSVT